MGRKQAITGRCKICGNVGELTFEHLPPRGAFNQDSVILHSLNYIADQSYQSARKKPERRHNKGLGEHSLCGSCNSFTGGEYGDTYISFAGQAMGLVDVGTNLRSIYIPFHVQPLNVLKQVVSMGMTGSSSGAMRHPDLARFLLDPRSRQFPTDYECYVYLVKLDSAARYCTEKAMFNTETGAMDHILVEFALPPLGCGVIQRNTERPSGVRAENLCSINHFARFDRNVWTTVYLEVPIHHIWSPTSLDYRKLGV